MAKKIYWIDDQPLGTMPKPNGGEYLEEDIAYYKTQNVDHIVSLLGTSGIIQAELTDEGKTCNKHQIDFTNFPIVDYGLPSNSDAFYQLTKSLADQIKNGKKVVAHCWMGIGRASITAAAILWHLGYPIDKAFQKISLARGLKVPDSKRQYDWMVEMTESWTETKA